MKNKIEAKKTVFLRKTIIISFLLAGFCLFLEPQVNKNLTFAINYFDNTKASPAQIETKYTPEDDINSAPIRQKSHAPEPSSLFLILGGLSGMIVRFAKKSFERFKRGIDIVLSLIGLTVTSPILILSAILTKLTSQGPVIYKQMRMGKYGEIFKIYKLRTMYIDAEKETGAVWAKENDPRITAVGKILRKTHIDEIPQLFNVLKGEMSIVGPRPERPELVRDLKTLVRDYEKRLQIKPGITGLAQVWHKYDETIEDVKKKISYDLLYIHNMRLSTDLEILGRTFVVALSGKGAR